MISHGLSFKLNWKWQGRFPYCSSFS